MEAWIAQAIANLAVWTLADTISMFSFMIGITSFFNRNERLFKFQLATSSALIGISLCFMGKETAGAIAILNAIRTVVSVYNKDNRIMILFILLTVGFGLALMKSPVELLPIVGTLITTWAMFKMQGLALRSIMLCATVLWLIHHIWAGSRGGILSEGSFFIINSFNIVRFYLMQKREQAALAANKIN